MKAVIAGLVLCGLAWLTSQRVTVWTEPVVFWTTVIQTAPDLPAAYLNRAAAEIQRRRMPAALTDLATGQTLAHERSDGDVATVDAVVRVNRATVLWLEHDARDAIALLEQDAPVGSLRWERCRAWGGCGAR